MNFKLVVTLVDRAQTLLLQEEKQLIKISLHSPFKRQEEVVIMLCGLISSKETVSRNVRKIEKE